jgi:hypothetical protein
VFWSKDGAASIVLGKGDFIAKQRVIKVIEVITVSCLVLDGTVAFVSVQVDEVCIILAVIETVGCARVALFE